MKQFVNIIPLFFKTLVFVGVFMDCFGVHSQILSVRDAHTQEPIDLVTIFTADRSAYTMTDAQGQADISAFQNQDQIVIQAMGYDTATQTYDVLKHDLFVLGLIPSKFELDQIVISASRWRQSAAKIPSKIVSISAQTVAFQNPQTAADLLDISGKVFIQKSQQGGGSPMIRGFATNRLLYSVDGVRMNTAIFRSGNIQNVISLDPLSLESTEILFGPDAVIYGSDAIGGVMSFTTLQPKFSASDKTIIHGSALTRFSSANTETTMHADVQVGWKKWSFLSSTTLTDYNDLVQGSHGPQDYLRPYYVARYGDQDIIVPQQNTKRQGPSGYGQINSLQKIHFRPNDHWRLSYALHYSQTSSYGRYDRHLRTKDNLPRYGQWDYGPQSWMMNHLSVSHKKSQGLYCEMALRLALQNFEESRISRGFNAPVRENQTEQVTAYSANLDFTKTINPNNKLFYGLEWVLNDVVSEGENTNIFTANTQPGPSRYPMAQWLSYGAYGSFQHQWSEQLMLQSGLRYNGIKLDAAFDTTFYPLPYDQAQIDTGSWTGNLGIVLTPGNQWLIRANYATAFRAPNVDDMCKMFDSEPGAVVIPNHELKPEYAYSWDTGVAKIINKKLKVDLSAYHTWLKNAMVRRDYKLNGEAFIIYDGELSRVQAIQNAATGFVYGLQAGFEFKLPAGFELTSDFNFQKGEQEMANGSKSPARHVAPWFGVTRLWFRANALNIQWYTRYSGGFSNDELSIEEQGKPEIYALDGKGLPYAPAWQTMNIKAQYTFDQTFTLSAGLENITDIRYRPYSSGISAAGRNLILSLRAQI